jgi:cysteine desulfurase
MAIYLDHAATTYLLPEVIDHMVDIMKSQYGNPSSIHNIGRKAKSIIEKSRKSIAANLKASVGEIYFTSSATEANNMVIKRSIIDLGVTRIVSCHTEHHCVIHSIDRVVKEQGVTVTWLNVNEQGDIDLQELESILSSHTNEKTLVSLMYANNELGIIHPVEHIAEICKKHEAYFHCDAVQAIGKMPIDLSSTRISFMTASSHKFHGPKGVGFLYMNNDNILDSYIDGGAQERNIRAGTESVAGISGMALALEHYIKNRTSNFEILAELQSHFEAIILENIPSVIINGQKAKNRIPHISSISFPQSERADMIMFNLDINGICASSGSACSAGIEEDSHVLTAIKHPPQRKTIRFSFGPNNTKNEINEVIKILKTII